MNELDPLHGIPASYCFSKVLPPSKLAGSYALPAVMVCTGITLLLRSTVTHGLQWTLYLRTWG